MEKVQGIYKIENIKTGRVYIGQSQNISNRFKEHRRALETNSHHSKKLQSSYNRSNDKSIFNFSVVERVEDKDKLNEREQFYIDYYDSLHNGYNCCDVGVVPNGCYNINNIKRKYYQSLLDKLNNSEYVHMGKGTLEMINGKRGYSWQTIKRFCIVLQWFIDNYDVTMFSIDVYLKGTSHEVFIKQNQKVEGKFFFGNINKCYAPIKYFGKINGEYKQLNWGDFNFCSVFGGKIPIQFEYTR